MLIVCPSCASQYELDAAKLGPEGRKVRCARCQTQWHVDASAEMPPVPSAEETQALLAEELERAAAIDAEVTAVAAEAERLIANSEAVPEEPPPVEVERRKPPRGKGRAKQPASKSLPKGTVIPAAAAVAGALLLGGLVWQRNAVVRAAPQLASLFEKAGLPVNVRGLSLSSIESGLVEDGTNRFLVVEGDVTNIAKRKTDVPLIQVSVRDEAGQALYTWTTEPPRGILEPSELMRFRARLASPPEKGRSVQVRFVSTAAAGAAAAAH
ncbi:zinc-ribbon domain-containing protein [Bosea sp. TND4EK4]|uniref:zinc-ribbon domain-containing protein n=1 Tax=Bosea sp. TND4EK4 TaxID=1907408 RepID=UPI0009546985|nr:zinc-ribbon domain-containing protein [Bosea sp. TND4EK4]SIR14601.1 MJ0042 family finger-like domain-containing protein [Bosea sp. TND4EK4]